MTLSRRSTGPQRPQSHPEPTTPLAFPAHVLTEAERVWRAGEISAPSDATRYGQRALCRAALLCLAANEHRHADRVGHGLSRPHSTEGGLDSSCSPSRGSVAREPIRPGRRPGNALNGHTAAQRFSRDIELDQQWISRDNHSGVRTAHRAASLRVRGPESLPGKRQAGRCRVTAMLQAHHRARSLVRFQRTAS